MPRRSWLPEPRGDGIEALTLVPQTRTTSTPTSSVSAPILLAGVLRVQKSPLEDVLALPPR